MKKIFLLTILLIINNLAFSQTKSSDIKQADLDKLAVLEDSIVSLSRTAVTDSIAENRIAAQDKLLPLMREALAVSNSFNYAFNKIENISLLYPTERDFRIFTWQLMIDENHYKYFGFIQLNRSKSMVYELKDFSKDIQKPENQNLTAEKWFGALYYNIKGFKTKEGMKYLLFGFNAHDTIEKIKICDVLSLNGGAPRFGSPVFEKEERSIKKKLNRLVMYHSVDASIRFNYDDDMGMIMLDHLTEIGYKDPNVPFVSVPDGTYEAYKLKKGVWEHIDKLENTIMDAAPIPKPILGSKAKVVNKENAKQFEWPKQ